MAATVKHSGILARFQGSLVGAVVGDCLGSPFEGSLYVKISDIVTFCDKIKAPRNQTGKKLEFTDDTAMARSVAASLSENKGLDVKHCAQRFVSEYFAEPWRGYGGSVVDVFQKLKESNSCDPFKPATEQFDGMGSYGNGGAMRIGPAALYGFSLSTEEICKIADGLTRITHTHVHAVNGARLQCLAVQHALDIAQKEVNEDMFIDHLFNQMDKLEEQPKDQQEDDGCDESSDSGADSPDRKKGRPSERRPFCAKLLKMKEILRLKDVSHRYIEEELGNDISALGSVPTAIYCFLHCLHPIGDFQVDNNFERSIMYAISLGGDTDTIASMAGAIAGAYYGIETIPIEWRQACEGVDVALDQAEKLSQLIQEPST